MGHNTPKLQIPNIEATCAYEANRWKIVVYCRIPSCKNSYGVSLSGLVKCLYIIHICLESIICANRWKIVAYCRIPSCKNSYRLSLIGLVKCLYNIIIHIYLGSIICGVSIDSKGPTHCQDWGYESSRLLDTYQTFFTFPIGLHSSSQCAIIHMYHDVSLRHSQPTVSPQILWWLTTNWRYHMWCKCDKKYNYLKTVKRVAVWR